MNTAKSVKWMLSLLLSGIGCICFAQHADSTAKVTSLDPVVVARDRILKEIIPVQILSGTELKNLSVHSVADALRYFSGVQIKDYGGIGGLKTINIRSLGSQHAGIFYDGIELGNAQNGTVDLGRFSLDNMMSISLYNGQKSAIFQSAKDFASAGSVYMASRIPEFAQGKKDNIKATFKTGSFGTVNPSLLWEHKINDHIKSSFNAEYLYTTGKYKFSYAKKNGYDTTETRRNGAVRSLRLEGGLFGKIKDGEWKAKAYLYTSDRGYPGAAVREDPGKFTHQDRQWDDNFFIQSTFRKNFSPRYSLQLNGKYAYDYLHFLSDPRLDVTTLYVNNHYRQQEAYVSAANLFTILPFWSVNLSGDFLFNTLNADLVDFVYPRRYTGLGALATSFDLSRLKIQASVLGTFVHETATPTTSAAPGRNEYTPAVILFYRPWNNNDINLRAFYKRIFRMPTLNDLYYTFIGNKLLDPEYTTQYDAGATYAHNFNNSALRRVELQFDGYFNQVKNKIVAMPTSNQFLWTMINLGYVEIRGLDLAARTSWQLWTNTTVNARLSYTWQKAQDFTDRTSPYYGGQIPYTPWHSGSLIVNPSWKSWSLNYSFIYTGKRYTAIANIPENYFKPWYTHDLSLSKELILYKNQCRLTAEVNNLLNQQYEVVQSYPMPGTNVKFIINVML
jgi:vitamin B12 transporter